MRERAGILNLVAELRGRLDELEQLVRTVPNHSIISPVSYDEDGVVAITPPEYTAFRTKGLDAPQAVNPYTPFPSFVQFGAPDMALGVHVSSFELSELHRTGTEEPAFGLRMVPQSAEKQAWFTYEILMSIENVTDYVWLEWVAKLSFDQPIKSFIQVFIEGDGYSETVDVGITAISEFATFTHVRLDRSSVLQASAGRPVHRIRLTFATGGVQVPMSIYGLSVFARV
jgi:hypothetical protein